MTLALVAVFLCGNASQLNCKGETVSHCEVGRSALVGSCVVRNALLLSIVLLGALNEACMSRAAADPPPLRTAVCGDQRASEMLRDLLNGTESLDIILVGDSNTAFQGHGWTDGLSAGLNALGAVQYATPLLPAAVDAPSIGYRSRQSSAVLSASTLASGAPSYIPGGNPCFSGTFSAVQGQPPQLRALFSCGLDTPPAVYNAVGLRPTGTETYALDFAWIPSSVLEPYANFGAAVRLEVGSLLGLTSGQNVTPPLTYRVVRGISTTAPASAHFTVSWVQQTRAATSAIFTNIAPSKSGPPSGWSWVANEVACPTAVNTSAAHEVFASFAGAGTGAGVVGPVAVAMQSIMVHRKGHAVQPLDYHGGATMTGIASDVTTATRATISTILGEIVARQQSAGGAGRVLVLMQGGINTDTGLPESWSAACAAIEDRIVQVWNGLQFQPKNLAFVAMVSHPTNAEDHLLSIRLDAASNTRARQGLTFVDLGMLTNAQEMADQQWYRTTEDHAHLSIMGYDTLSVRVLKSLLPYRRCPADLTGDGLVDAADFTNLLSAWTSPRGDIDGDGLTDAADVTALLSAWGVCQ